MGTQCTSVKGCIICTLKTREGRFHLRGQGLYRPRIAVLPPPWEIFENANHNHAPRNPNIPTMFFSCTALHPPLRSASQVRLGRYTRGILVGYLAQSLAHRTGLQWERWMGLRVDIILRVRIVGLVMLRLLLLLQTLWLHGKNLPILEAGMRGECLRLRADWCPANVLHNTRSSVALGYPVVKQEFCRLPFRCATSSKKICHVLLDHRVSESESTCLRRAYCMNFQEEWVSNRSFSHFFAAKRGKAGWRRNGWKLSKSMKATNFEDNLRKTAETFSQMHWLFSVYRLSYSSARVARGAFWRGWPPCTVKPAVSLPLR